MPVDDLRALLAGLKAVVSPSTEFYFNFDETQVSLARAHRRFNHSEADLSRLLGESGYEFRVLEDWHGDHRRMALATLKVETVD